MSTDKSIPDLDEMTVDFITNLFKTIIEGTLTNFEAKILALETTVENLEKQLATLILGYGEQAVFMEALVAQLAFASDEARSAFQKDVSEARKEMLEVMQNASKGLLADQSENFTTALADMAESKLSDSDS